MKRWLAAALLILSLATPAFADNAKSPADNAKSPPAPAASTADVLPAPTVPAPARLDAAKAALDKITASVADETIHDADLVKLRGDIDPILSQVIGVSAEVAPKQAAAKARLDQLGPPPPDTDANSQAPPEDPQVTQERKDQLKLQATLDDLAKRAKLLQVKAEQLATQIGERRRTLFTNMVFLDSASILSPALWMDVAKEMPADLASAGDIFAEFLVQLRDLSGSKAALAAAALALILLGAVLSVLAAIRVLPREKPHRELNNLRISVAALWSGLAIMAPPLVATGALYALIDWLNISDPQLRRLGLNLLGFVVRLSVTAGMITAILAPSRAYWRPIDLSDRVAGRLARLIFTLMVVASIGKMVEVLAETVGASLAVSVAARGFFALVIGVSLARGLYGIVVAPEAKGQTGAGRPANITDESPFWAPIRFIAWLATIAVIGAAALGYVALSAFLVNQMAWTAFIGGALFLLLKLSDGAMAQGFRPNSRMSRNLTATLGVGRESLQQVGVLLSGMITVALSAAAIMLALAPWGIQSHDMIGAVQSLFFGVKIGDITLSLSSVVLALVLFAVGYGLTGAVRGWLESRYLPLTQLDLGLRAAISASVGYVGFALSLGVAVSYVGISLEKLALVAGALSVGIGLGLQGVVANFVSGLIIMWERAIRVGDLVNIGGEQGYVRRINIRSTEIQTADRAMTIVPNGNMITGVVKNFVRSDRVGRVVIPVQATWESDPEQVRQVLIDTAKAHDEVVGFPSPFALFVKFSAMLEFELYCFVEDIDRAGRVKSDLHFAIFSAFQEAGIKMVPAAAPAPAPLDAATIEPLLRALSASKDMKN